MGLMKAIVQRQYGSPDVLELQELDKPVVGDEEVLVRVRAAALNPVDWHFMRGEPYIMRAGAGIGKPRVTRLGVDLAGQVEAVGCGVTQFKSGDEVFGTQRGAFAEYVNAQQGALALKPANLTFEQAAAVPVAGLTALQGLRDKGKLRPGQKVLINGASGGVGTFAVQIARWFGADVTGVCSTRNLETVRSLGADRVVDYTLEDFTRNAIRYDLILDAVGNRSLPECLRALTAQGYLVLVGAPSGRWLAPLPRLLRAMVLSLFVSQKLVPILTSTVQEDLIVLKDLIESEEVTPIVDRQYGLCEVPQAMSYLEAGHARGKVVISMGDFDT
ncbi:MAG: NAD(P)-dependent alcohol dehydrogenase [Trueperaceae bacterium]